MLNAALRKLEKESDQAPIAGYDVSFPPDVREEYIISVLKTIGDSGPLSTGKGSPVRLLDSSSENNSSGPSIDTIQRLSFSSLNRRVRQFPELKVDITFRERGVFIDTGVTSTVTISDGRSGQTVAEIERHNGFASRLIGSLMGKEMVRDDDE